MLLPLRPQEQKDIEAKERKRQAALQPKNQPTPIPEEGGEERRVRREEGRGRMGGRMEERRGGGEEGRVRRAGRKWRNKEEEGRRRERGECEEGGVRGGRERRMEHEERGRRGV